MNVRYILAILSLCLLSGHAEARHGQVNPSITCNFVTGIASDASTCASPAAVCNGSNDDRPAWDSFNSWAVTWSGSHTGIVEVYIPTGANCSIQTATPGAVSGITWLPINIPKLRIVGYGASLTSSGSGRIQYGVPNAICQHGIADASGCSARINTAVPGATTVTLTAASLASGYVSRFTVGNYMTVGGFDLQNGQGNPPNLHYHDFVKITAINAGTGVITFSPPLTHTYESTWPLYGAGTSTTPDSGGPATIWAMPANWDAQLEVFGLTTQDRTFQLAAALRSQTFRDMTLTGANCIIPTTTYSWSLYNSTGTSCTVEVDKLINYMDFGGNSWSSLNSVSSSIDNMYIYNSSFSGNITGSAKNTWITGSTIGGHWQIGATSYGRSDYAYCNNSTFTGGFTLGGVTDVGNGSITTTFTMSNGTITVPKTYTNGTRFAVPGSNLFWHGSFTTEKALHVIDVTEDASNSYVTTDWPGTPSWPAVPVGASLGLYVHPAPQFTQSGCTGFGVTSLAGAAANAPLYSYFNQTFNGTQIGTVGAPGQMYEIWGTVSSVEWNVTAAYTGAGTLSLHAFDPNDTYPTIKSDYSQGNYGPTINLKQTGDRKITGANTATCDGSAGTCSGDGGYSLPQANVWFSKNSRIAGSADISGTCSSSPSAGCPTITITTQTDQGVQTCTQTGTC